MTPILQVDPLKMASFGVKKPPELKADKNDKRGYATLKNGVADEWDALAKVQHDQIKK